MTGAPVKNRVAVGQRVGRGVVTDPEVRVQSGQREYRGARLQCDCGQVYTALVSNLVPRRSGKVLTTSCGCRRREASAVLGRRQVHGLWRHPLYHTWRMMVRRCTNPADPKWHRYGGRGISVYGPWHDVSVFIADIEGSLGVRPVGCTLDRKNNDGNYEPGNVQWATALEQAANREYQLALAFLVWARQHHSEIVIEFQGRF